MDKILEFKNSNYGTVVGKSRFIVVHWKIVQKLINNIE